MLILILPVALVWLVLYPGYIFIMLTINRRKLETKRLIDKFGFFYIGYKDKYYYWELIKMNTRIIIFGLSKLIDNDVKT